MRLSERMKVDLPQPLGPMIAVTALEAISIVTPSVARFAPYQIERFLTRNVYAGALSSAGGLSTSSSTRSITLRSRGVMVITLSIRKDAKQPMLHAPASGF